MYTLEEIKKITDEKELENVILRMVNKKTELLLEDLSATKERKQEIKEELQELERITDYFVKDMIKNF